MRGVNSPHRNENRKRLSIIRDKHRIITAAGLGVVAVLTTAFMVGSINLPSDSNAENIAMTIRATDYYLNVDAAETKNLVLETVPDASAVAAVKDTITVTTNATGYQLYLGMANTTNANSLVGETYGDALEAMQGTVASPVTLSTQTNKWGFAVKQKPSTKTITAWNTGFNAAYDAENITDSSLWAGVPEKGSEQKINQTDAKSPTGAGDTIDIWYAVRANTTIKSDTYKGVVAYTAVAEGASTGDGMISAVASNADLAKFDGSGTLTIDTTLMTLMNITPSDVVVRIDDTTGAGTGGTTCAVTNVAISAVAPVSIQCTLPALNAGAHKVTVVINKFGKTYNLDSAFTMAPTGTMNTLTVSPTEANGGDETTFTITTGVDYTAVPTGSAAAKIGNDTCTFVSWVDGTVGTGKVAFKCKATPTAPDDDTASRAVTVSSLGTKYGSVSLSGANVTVKKAASTMQAFAANNTCSTINESDGKIFLQDVRGGGYANDGSEVDNWNDNDTSKRTYAIQKLADGKCWMLQNLNIVGQTISAADSDFSGDDITLPNALGFGSSNSASVVNVWHAYYVGDTDADRSRHTGAYYNWYTATAGTGTYEMTDGQEATSSICPAGWHLPKAGTLSSNTLTTSSGNDWYNVISRYTISGLGSWNTGSNPYWSGDARDGLANAPLYLPTAGHVNNSAVSNKANHGYYWSSMAQSANYAYYLGFNSSNTYPRDYNDKYYGFSVRCVTE